MRPHVRAGVVIALLIISIRIAIAVQVGWIMLFPLFAVMIIVTRLSPPVAALSQLYGWALFGGMDFAGFWIIPRIPTISTLAVWTVLWLLHWRRVDGSLKHVDQPVVIGHFVLVSLFFSIGFLGAFQAGHLSNPLVRLYVLDIVRGWLGYLVIALLGCRNWSDLKIVLIGLPFAFLIFPLTLPLQAWQDFFGYGLFSASALSRGLNYGSLNTNTLGQAAAVASVVAAAVALTLSRSRLRRWMLTLLVVAGAIAFMTFSRQSLISWLVGLFVIGIALGSRRGIVWLVILSLSVYIGAQAVTAVLPAGSGFYTRLVELTEPPETWESRSFTIRQSEYEEAVERWLEAPLFGVGFGGQRFDVIASVDRIPGEYNFALRGTHNLFLGILVQTGLAGMLLLLAFALSLLRCFLRIVQRAPGLCRSDARLARTAIMAAFACMFVQQNISGGLGLASSSLMFLLGALLGVSGATHVGEIAEAHTASPISLKCEG